jgi:hypothetical protein
MANREQHSKKEAKKPKQDKKGGKPLSPISLTPIVTTVIPDKGKKKNKG